jgi:CRP-like cAMP-binding protein
MRSTVYALRKTSSLHSSIFLLYSHRPSVVKPSKILLSLSCLQNRTFSTSGSYFKDEWQEENFFTSLKRKGMLMKAKMIEKQQVCLRLPEWFSSFLFGKRTFSSPSASASSNIQVGDTLQQMRYQVTDNTSNHSKMIIFPYTLSDLAGHGSFLFLAFGYMETDFLNLRLYAFSGICLSVIFQYYREKPLWIPIRWNTLFLLINAVMILALLKEQNDASNIPEEQRFLYKNVFERRGMNSVDFLHLISLARRMEFKKNEKLVDETKKNTRVYLVKKGNLTILKNGQKVGNIHKHQFVGAMSFLTWEGKKEQEEHDRKEKDAQESLIESTFSSASSSSSSSSDGQSGEDSQERTVSESASESGRPGRFTSILLDVPDGELHSSDDSSDDKCIDDAVAFSASTSTAEGDDDDRSFLDYSFGWLTSSNAETVNPDTDSETQEAEEKSAAEASVENYELVIIDSKKDEDGYLGAADVVADEDVVVYSWKFKDLRQLIQNDPRVGYGFERCLSEDLNKKMSTSWDQEIQARYKQILYGALMDGEVRDFFPGFLCLYLFSLSYAIID